MRIMIVTDQYAPMVGGVPTVTRALARGLADRGHTVALLAPSPDRRGRRGTDGRASVDFRGSVPWPWYDGMRLAAPARPGRAGALAGFGPDVVHLHSPVTLGVAARRAAARRGVPVVYTNHYLPLNVWPAAPARAPPAFDAAFYSFVIGFANRCNHVTAPTATALRLLREHGLRVPSRSSRTASTWPRFSPGPATTELRSRYGAARGRPADPVGRQAQPGEAGGRAARRARPGSAASGPAAGWPSPAPGPLAGTGPEARCAAARATAWPSGCGSSASFPTTTCPACTGWPTCSPSPPQAELQSPGHHGGDGEPACPSSRSTRARSANSCTHGEQRLPRRPRTRRRRSPTTWPARRDPGLRARMGEASACGSSPTTTGISCSARWESHLPRRLARRGTAEHVNGERWPALNSRPCRCSSSSVTPAAGTAARPRPSRRRWSGRCPAGSCPSSATRCAAPTWPAAAALVRRPVRPVHPADALAVVAAVAASDSPRVLAAVRRTISPRSYGSVARAVEPPGPR